MFLMYFTERPYAEIPEETYKTKGMRSLLFSNENLEPVRAGVLYNRYFDENLYAEEVGFEGLMLNEHHNTPACLGSIINIEAAILARITKKPKLILLGNVLPINENPLRLAEETAMVDCISGGRLVSGFVRGGGVEQFATNSNPAYKRERFAEALDFIFKAWTTSGPWRWEGKHFQYRVVNPWIHPIQQPLPVWIPGSASPETLVWCAERRYPYVALATLLPTTQDMFKIYKDAATEIGYETGPQNFGYLQRVQVQDTEEEAYRAGKGFTYSEAVMGLCGPVNQAWMEPPPSGVPVQGGAEVIFCAPHPSGPHLQPDDLRGGAGELPDPRRHAQEHRAQAAPRSGDATAGHPRHMGQQRHHQPRRHAKEHAPHGPGGHAGAARDLQGAGTDRPL